MVNTCVVWGCTNRSKPGDSSLKFFDIPKVIEHQGIQTKELTSERRRIWLARINRADFSPDPSKRHFKVCSDHFIQGKYVCLRNYYAQFVFFKEKTLIIVAPLFTNFSLYRNKVNQNKKISKANF